MATKMIWEDVYKGEMHLGKGGKKGKGEKYAVPGDHGAKKGGSKKSSDEPDKTINGEQILICDMAGASYNDLPWAIVFGAMIVATAVLAVYKNLLGAPKWTWCRTARPNRKNGGKCKELSVVVNGRVGHPCLCSGG